MIKSKFGILIIMFFVIINAQAGGYKEMKDTSAFIVGLNKMTSSLITIEAEFRQIKNLSMLSDKVISKGTFHYKKTDMIRWQYILPYEYLLIINKDKVFVKDENKSSKFDIKSNKVFRKVNDLLSDCMKGTVLNKRKEYKVLFFENEINFMAKLYPLEKNTRDFISTIELYFDKKDFSINKVIIIEPAGDNTEISFTQKKINQPIADEKFRIK